MAAWNGAISSVSDSDENPARFAKIGPPRSWRLAILGERVAGVESAFTRCSERPGLLLGELPWTAEGDGDPRLHGVAFVVAAGDGMALVVEGVRHGVVEEDVQVERPAFHADDLFVANVRGTGRELRIGAQQD